MKTTVAVAALGIIALALLAVPFFASLTAGELVLCGFTLIVVGVTSMLVALKGWKKGQQ